MMKVLYDYQIFCEQKFGGISRYFYELINGFRQSTTIEPILKVSYAENDFSEALLKSNHWLTKVHFKGKKDLVRLINFLQMSSILQKSDYDIYHPTYYRYNIIKKVKAKPVIITIHDLIDEKFNMGNSKFSHLIENRKNCIERADAIITISESTRLDLLQYYKIPEKKIHVVYHGNSLRDINADGIELPYEKDSYLLHVGSRKGIHKNFFPFIEAIQEVLRNTKVKLVCAGGGAFNPQEIDLFKNLNIAPNLEFCEIESDTYLAALYRNALALIYPSIYEGFGFPIVEAFSQGCPVITSEVSSMKEIGGDAAIYFDPLSPNNIKTTIQKVIEEPEYRTRRIDDANKNADKFSWLNCLQRTSAIYQTI